MMLLIKKIAWIAGLVILSSAKKTDHPLVEKTEQNDQFFPPSASAAKFINFDKRGFMINGRRTFITSGSIHYPRVPQQYWHEVLLKLKRAGFNTVESYVFWNYHELKEGQFDFTSEGHNLGAFLDEAKKVGLFVIMRVGPYVCSEWENGGYPTWLTLKPGIEVRKNNPVYLTYVDKWFNKVLPIISSRQIQNGGNVILVQLENEMPGNGWKYWGTEMDGPYFRHLLDLAHQNGLEVPLFFSGMHHAHDPAPEKTIDPENRKGPWISTELWTTWFDRYGNDGLDLRDDERHPWRVLAQGGNGFNLYMFHGGSTFNYYSFNNDKKFDDKGEKGATSYDFGTLVGQAGDTRPIYARLKRLAYFAETFSPILAGSRNSSAQYQDFAQNVKITARTAADGLNGTLIFLDNPGGDTTAVLKSGMKIRLAAGEIAAFSSQVPVIKGVTIAEANTRILGIVPQGDITTIVCYGESGDPGNLTFLSKVPAKIRKGKDSGFIFDVRRNSLRFNFPVEGNGEELLGFGKETIRVLVMSKETADKTWFIKTRNGRHVVVGAPYLGEYNTDRAGKPHFDVSYPWTDSTPTGLIDYQKIKPNFIKLPLHVPAGAPDTIKLGNWEMSAMTEPIKANLNDGSWFALADGTSPEMGQDMDYSAYAWYHSTINSEHAITSLKFERIGDRASFFVDGEFSAGFDIKKDKTPDISINIPPGTHDLGVFVAQQGRDKFAGFTGDPHKLLYQKGLRGPVTSNGTTDQIFNWKMKGGVDPFDPNLHWRNIAVPMAIPSFYKTHFRWDGTKEPDAVYRLITNSLSFGSVWLNGHHIGRYPEIIKKCPGIWLPECWMINGDNTLTIFDEQGKTPTSVKINLESGASRHHIVL